jgi:hypothetical protein
MHGVSDQSSWMEPKIVPPRWQRSASAFMNGRALVIHTQRCYRACGLDHEFEPLLLTPQTDDAEIGRNVVSALQASRMLPLAEVRSFFDWRAMSHLHDEWQRKIIAHYGFSSRSDLFSVSVR